MWFNSKYEGHHTVPSIEISLAYLDLYMEIVRNIL